MLYQLSYRGTAPFGANGRRYIEGGLICQGAERSFRLRRSEPFAPPSLRRLGAGFVPRREEPTMGESNRVSKRSFFRMQGRRVEVFGRSFELPASRLARIAIGLLLIVGGCFAFLPVLGVWMLPLGFMVLSIDIAIVRRWRRRTEVRWSRWRASRARRAEG
jgi:hypothetical protein